MILDVNQYVSVLFYSFIEICITPTLWIELNLFFTTSLCYLAALSSVRLGYNVSAYSVHL